MPDTKSIDTKVQIAVAKASGAKTNGDDLELKFVRELAEISGSSTVVTAGEFMKIYEKDFKTRDGKEIKISKELKKLKSVIGKMAKDTQLIEIGKDSIEETVIFYKWLGFL